MFSSVHLSEMHGNYTKALLCFFALPCDHFHAACTEKENEPGFSCLPTDMGASPANMNLTDHTPEYVQVVV